jgi:ATP synthase protein I
MPYHPPIPDPKQPGKDPGRNPGLVSAIVQAEKMVQIALILPCAAFIGWLGGAWIGNRVHRPWIAAVGVAFGGAAGLFYVIRLAMDSLKNTPDDQSGNGNGKNGASKNS